MTRKTSYCPDARCMFRNCFADFYLRLNGSRRLNKRPRFQRRSTLFRFWPRFTIKNLTQDDSVLLEDGVSQKIDYFSEEANLPLTVGLLVDRIRSQREVLDQERRASYTPFSIKFCASEQIARLWFSSTCANANHPRPSVVLRRRPPQLHWREDVACSRRA